METIEERRAAAKRKLEAAKEAVAQKQSASSQSVTKLRQEAPIGRPPESENSSPKERARELAEKAAAEKAERLAAQRRLREEASIASQKEKRSCRETATNSSWQPSLEREEAIKTKLAAAASAQSTQRLLNVKAGNVGCDGVAAPRLNSQMGAAEPQVAAIYQYLQKQWQSPAVSGALMTLERQWQLVLGKVLDSRVRLLGFGEISRRYGGDSAQALETIHTELGYTLGDTLGVPAPDYEVQEDRAVFSLSFDKWADCQENFVEDYKEPVIIFAGGNISSLAYQYLLLFFSQLVLTVVDNSTPEEPFELATGPIPQPLLDLFLENMCKYYLSKIAAPALFETQPVRQFCVRQAVWLRQRGWGQH